MRIQSLAVAFPKRKVTNADIIGEVRNASRKFQGDLEQTLKFIDRTLRQTGTHTRYWTNGSSESSLSLTVDSCRRALARLEDGQKIDLVICASVFSELIEPATANLVAHELGMDDVECLDIKEACDGWMKAMKIADSLIKTGGYRRILVVNGEFSMAHSYAIRPHLFALKSGEELVWRFPIYTIGEAATATIVERDDTNPWKHTNVTRNDLYDLCTVAPAWHKQGSFSQKVAKDGPGRFTSWAAELTGNGIPLAIETFKRSGIDTVEVDHLFTHASSKKDWAKIAGEIGMSNKIFDIHGRTGNLVSASIPAAMALAVEDKVLKRGQKVAVLCASAGMTFSTAEFRF
jgi:3-oxoacyl-[acyl-carrier-protein] synthase III